MVDSISITESPHVIRVLPIVECPFATLSARVTIADALPYAVFTVAHPV